MGNLCFAFGKCHCLCLAYQSFLPRNSNSRLLQTFLFPRPSFKADRGHGFGRSCAPAAQQERTIAGQQFSLTGSMEDWCLMEEHNGRLVLDENNAQWIAQQLGLAVVVNNASGTFGRPGHNGMALCDKPATALRLRVARQASVVQTGCAPEMAWASLSPPFTNRASLSPRVGHFYRPEAGTVELETHLPTGLRSFVV